MASMIGLQSLGIRVDFPDEPKTGGDMERIYAAPHEINGGSYLRLILQAKRAQRATVKHGNYWYYSHLDHDSGKQAQTLVAQSTASPGTLPLYVFYHPTPALQGVSDKLPAIEGVNVVFASDIAPVVRGGCGRADKKTIKWRPNVLPLSDLLCWTPVYRSSPQPGGAHRIPTSRRSGRCVHARHLPSGHRRRAPPRTSTANALDA